MRKMIKKLATGILLCSLLVSTNAWSQIPAEASVVEAVSETTVTPRITVGKYVEIEREYASVLDVPEYYYHSYYDHDYNTTLHGYLEIKTILNYGTYVVAIYYGHCCGTI